MSTLLGLRILENLGLLSDAIKLDPAIVNSSDTDVLEDLIIAAVNDAHAKVDQTMAEEMQKLTGGLPLPPGMKLPF